MATNGNSLTPKQARALSALMESRDVKEAAKTAKVGERTLYRWMNEDAVFQAALRGAIQQGIDAAIRRLAWLASFAVGALAKELVNINAPSSAKIRAADVILSRLLNLKELADLEARIVALEEKNK